MEILLKNRLVINIEFSIFTGQRKSKTKSTTTSSTDSSRMTVQYINQILEKLKATQTRKSTMNNYHSIWRHFNNFLIELNLSETPTSWEERTVLFGTHLVDTGSQSATIRSYFSAIKHVLKSDGYDWNDQKAMLNTITRSCRLINDTVKIRLPITRNLLDMLNFEIERKFTKQLYLEYMFKAVFNLAYYGMMRVGEIGLSNHTLKAKDVHIGYNKDKVLLVLHSSKTHGKESVPQKIKIEALKESKRFFCPFKILRKYMNLRGNYEEDTDAFIAFSDGSAVPPEHLRAVLRELLKNLGLNALLYDFHSCRAGRTVDMARMNYSLEYIRKAGRWRSNAVYKYLKLQ